MNEPIGDFERPPTFDAFGVPLATINPQSFVAALERWLQVRTPATPGAFVCFRDVHGLVRAWSDERLAAAHHAALMVTADGAPLAWLARRRGHLGTAQVCGPEMLPAVCRHGVSRGWRHAFFGSTPAVLDALAASLSAAAPGLVVAAQIAPPFGEVAPAHMAAMVADLRRARPDFVWVGLGSPKQELWMAEHAAAIDGALCMGVGAAFDMHAGAQRRAAAPLRRLGLEWLWRLAQEPGRLGPRYASVVPRFLWSLAAEELRLSWRGRKA